MIPIEQQMKLVRLAGGVETPYDLVRYNLRERRIEVVVMPEPNPPSFCAGLDADDISKAKTPVWWRLHRSLVATGDN